MEPDAPSEWNTGERHGYMGYTLNGSPRCRPQFPGYTGPPNGILTGGYMRLTGL